MTPKTPPQSSLKESSIESEEKQAEKIYISLLARERVIDGDDIDDKSPFVVGESTVVETSEKERDSRDIYINSHDEHNMGRKLYDTPKRAVDFGLIKESSVEIADSKKDNSIVNCQTHTVKVYDTGLPSKQEQQLIKVHQVRQSTHLEPEPPFFYKLKKRRGSYRKNIVNNRIGQFLNGFEELYPIGYTINKQELEYWIQRLSLANDRLAINQYLQRFLMHGYFTVRNGLFTFKSKQPNQPSISEIMNIKKNIQTLRAATRKPRKKRSW